MKIEITIHNDNDEVVDLLQSLHRKVDKMATDITALETVIEQLAEVEGAAVAELQDLASQISTLEVGNITQDQVDALKDKAQTAVEALTDATTKAKEEHPDEEPAPPLVQVPSKPVYTVNPEADTTGVDQTQYLDSGFETVPAEGGTAQTLFYFSGDSDGSGQVGTANGSNAVYAVYTGSTQVA